MIDPKLDSEQVADIACGMLRAIEDDDAKATYLCALIDDAIRKGTQDAAMEIAIEAERQHGHLHGLAAAPFLGAFADWIRREFGLPTSPA